MLGQLKSAVQINFLAEDTELVKSALRDFDCGLKALNEFAYKQLTKRDNDGKHRAIIASVNGQLAGYLTLAPDQLVVDTSVKKIAGFKYNSVPVLVIQQIATDLKFQKQGVAKKLMQHAFNTAISISKDAGITGVALWAHPDAVSFYEYLGFIKLSVNLKNDPPLTHMFLHIDSLIDAVN